MPSPTSGDVNMSMFSGSKSPSNFDVGQAQIVSELDFFSDDRKRKPGDDGDTSIQLKKEICHHDPGESDVNVSI